MKQPLLPHVWASFHCHSGTWVSPSSELQAALAELVREDTALSQLQAESSHTQANQARPSIIGSVIARRSRLGSVKARGGVSGRFSLSTRQRQSVRMSTVGGEPPEPGEPSTLLAVSLSFNGEKVTLPVDASLKGLSPSGLIEQPALLLKLVNERLDHLKAKVSWVEGARAERSRAGRLQAATRTVNKGLWWRLRGLPLLQRIFILVMLLAAALIFVDGGTAIAAADTAISSVDESIAADLKASLHVSGIALLLIGTKIVLICGSSTAPMAHQAGCMLVAALVMLRSIVLWICRAEILGSVERVLHRWPQHAIITIGLGLSSAYWRATPPSGQSLLWLAQLLSPRVTQSLNRDLPSLKHPTHSALLVSTCCDRTARLQLCRSCGADYHTVCLAHAGRRIPCTHAPRYCMGEPPCIDQTDHDRKPTHTLGTPQRAESTLNVRGPRSLCGSRGGAVGPYLARCDPCAPSISTLNFEGLDQQGPTKKEVYNDSEQRMAVVELYLDGSWWALAACVANGVALATIFRLYSDRAVLFTMQQKADQALSSATDEDDDESLEALVGSQMHKLPLRIRRHLKTSEEERALLFAVAAVRYSSYNRASPPSSSNVRSDTYSSPRTSTHLDGRGHRHYMLSRLYTYTTIQRRHSSLRYILPALNATADDLSLTLQAQSEEHARRWVCALGVLLRATTAHDAHLSNATMRRIRTAYQLAAGSHESLTTASRQIAFFSYLNRGMNDESLKRLQASAAAELGEGDESSVDRERAGSYPSMLTALSRCDTLVCGRGHLQRILELGPRWK